MDIRMIAPSLTQLDELRCEALLLPLFEDERPLRGALGLLDWRLCGFISRMVADKRIDGRLGETTLIPGRPRLHVDKLVLFGLGPSSAFTPDLLSEVLGRMNRVSVAARVRSYAMVLPGRSLGCIDAEAAVELFLAQPQRQDQDEITLIDAHEDHKRMAAVVERARRRARAARLKA